MKMMKPWMSHKQRPKVVEDLGKKNKIIIAFAKNVDKKYQDTHLARLGVLVDVEKQFERFGHKP